MKMKHSSLYSGIAAPLQATRVPAVVGSMAKLAEEKTTLERERERRIRQGLTTADIDQRLRALSRERRLGRVLEAETVLGSRYVLHQMHGSGGLGEVWRAYDRQKRGNVAVRVLRGKHARDPSKVERFCFGGQVMAALRHPAIPCVLSPPVSMDDLTYFVMEYVESVDLLRAVVQHN